MAKEGPAIVKMSDLPEGREEAVEVIVMDKKLRRRLKLGEEQDIEDIAKETGVEEIDIEAPPSEGPGGTTLISGPTINYSDLANAIVRDFGPPCKGGKIFLSDSLYFLYPDDDIKRVLSQSLIDLQMWIAQYFDCDDFAQVTAGIVNQQLKGIPFGTLWFKGPGIYHAVNCFYSYNQRKMKVVEPQTDAIYDFNKSRYCPVLVVI